MKLQKRSRVAQLDGLLCASLCVVLLLCARPFVEIGLFDDFSYVRTAWDFDRTGHLIYNGWATAMLGWQIVWAAPFVHALGHSFFAPRVSVVLLYFLLLLLLHAIAVRLGLRRQGAAFATLLTGLSPLTVPLAVSFMTDIAGMLVIAVCLYCAIRVLRASGDRAALLWLAAGFVLGAAGGTARQIAWLAPLVMMPCAAWLCRRRRGALVLGGMLWLGTLGTILYSLHWFALQPFHVPEQVPHGPFNLGLVRVVVQSEVAALLLLAALLVPVFALGFGHRRFPGNGWRKWGTVVAAAVVVTAVAFVLTRHQNEHGWLPWTSDVVDRMNLFDGPGLWAKGPTPATFGMAGRAVLSLLTVFCGLAFAFGLRQSKPRATSEPDGSLSWQETGWLLLPFSAAYLLLLVPRAIAEHQVLDRYMLPLLMLAAMLLLRLAQERLQEGVPLAAWVTLAVVSLWSVASLHDFIAGFRARLEAAEVMQAGGITPRQMNLGWEFDGMGQVRETGYVVDSRVTYPAGAQVDVPWPASMPTACRKLFLVNTPALRQEYFIVHAPQPCLGPSQFRSVQIHRWLPPYNAQFQILKLNYPGQPADGAWDGR